MKVAKVVKRGIVIAAVALTAATLIVPGAIAAQLASDVVPDPSAPRPVNILPSTVKGSLPLTGVPGQQQYLATMLYSYARQPGFWQAAAAVNAGTATSQQITLVQSANGSWSMPATRGATLTKVVGGVSTVIGGYTAGVSIGAGTLDVARDLGLIGFDPDGSVCAAVGGTLAGLLGADCTAFNEIPEGFVPNEDAGSSGTFAPICNAAGTYCLQLLASVPYTWKPSSTWWTRRMLCFDRTVGSGAVPSGFLYGKAAGTGTSPVPPSGTGPAQVANAGIWQSVSVSNLTTLSRSGAQYNPNPTTCPAGTDFAWEYGWNNQGGTNATGVTWGVPDLPLAFKIESAGPESVPATSDPLRTLRCVIVASGSTYSADSATFRESEGVLPAPVCPDVPAGLTLESTEIREVNLEDGTWLTLWSESTTDEYQAAQALAPECSGGTCLLDLRKNDTSCFQQPTTCAGWFSDPNKDSTYSCQYGTHAVDLAECTIYAPAFEPSATTTGNTYGDPTSGAAVTNPNPTPGTDPDGSGEACYPQGWAVFNPVEWVYRPIVCAAEWAFVPRPEVVEEVGDRVAIAWDDTLPAQVPEIVGAWAGAIPTDDDDSCLGPPINFDAAFAPFGLDGGGTMYPLSACDEPWSTLAVITNWVTLGTVAWFGALACVRYLAATFGFVGFGKGGGEGSTS